MSTARVKFLRGTSLGNGSDAAPGEVVELDTRLVAQFVQQGRVLVLDDSAAPVSAPASETPPADSEPSKPIRKGRK